MPRTSLIHCAAFAVLLSFHGKTLAQNRANDADGSDSYRLKLQVDEVVLTFHASDAQGLPVNDIKADEIKLWDNGKPPRRIVAFNALLDRPIRIGILIDSSESMTHTMPLNKAIAERYVQQLLRPKSDEAFVGDFGYTSETVQSWTNDPSLLLKSIRNVTVGRMNPIGGTAIFDAVFRACFYGFGKVDDPTATGNLILLFSDGEDNAGQTTLLEAHRACQRSNTTIYAFQVPPDSRQFSPVPKNLRELVEGTGGHLFPADDTDEAILNDLRTIESEIRNQYRQVYNPASLKRDGSFHEIEIQPPDRVATIEVRPGYYAPAQ